MPLPRANRNRVAELAIKHLPRPDGYTTPPPVRPNNRGHPLTPLLEGQRVGELVMTILLLEQELEETTERLHIARKDLDAAGNAVQGGPLRRGGDALHLGNQR